LTGKTTLHDIARRLGLSTTTVSLALRDHPRISKATKDRVRKLIAELKYEPDQVARALVMGRAHLIGVVVPNSSDPYYSEVFRGIEDAVRSANYHVLLANGSYDLEGYAQRVAEMKGLRVGGVLIAPPFSQESPQLSPFFQDLRERKFPVVLINRRLKPPLFHQVSADYSAGVKAVIETLASLGHRRVAYISGHPALLPIRQRLADFKRYAARHGFEDDPALIVSSELTSAGGYASCGKLWAGLDRKPTAIVAFSDSVGIGALRFLLDSRVQIPNEVSLVTFDGIEATEFTHPSLSTVATPMYEIGKKVFSLLMDLIEDNQAAPQDVVLPTVFVPRESIGVAPKQPGTARIPAAQSAIRSAFPKNK
jgi:LacI family transcriptional regulator